jgi:hypothetical protein
MCRGHLAKTDFDAYVNYISNVERWKRSGKSHDFIVRKLRMGCPSGKKKCSCGCGEHNGGKASGKGKGRNRINKRSIRDF